MCSLSGAFTAQLRADLVGCRRQMRLVCCAVQEPLFGFGMVLRKSAGNSA
jgi:hypothetical protein